MSNHLHIVLRISPKATREWTDREVIERWQKLHPWEKDVDGKG